MKRVTDSAMTRRQAVALGASVVCAGCGVGSRSRQFLMVGAQSAPEHRLVGEIIAQIVAKKFGPEKVGRRFDYPSAPALHEGLVTGEVDIGPEYASTIVSALLRLPPAADAEAMRAQVRYNYQNQKDLDWLGPLGFSSAPVLVVKTEVSRELNVTTLAQAAASQNPWKIAVDSGFQSRPDGMPLLMRRFRLRLGSPVRIMDRSKALDALRKDTIDMMLAYDTEALLEDPKLLVLKDEQMVLPLNEAGVTVRHDAAKRANGLTASIEVLTAKLPTKVMRSLNRAVEVDRRPVAEVAAEFLRSAGL